MQSAKQRKGQRETWMGVPPGGGCGCQRGLLFFVGAFDRELSQVSHVKVEKFNFTHPIFVWLPVFSQCIYQDPALQSRGI